MTQHKTEDKPKPEENDPLEGQIFSQVIEKVKAIIEPYPDYEVNIEVIKKNAG